MKPDSRKLRRFVVQLPTTFGNEAKPESGTVLNLSFQGCAMTTETMPAVGTYLSLQIDLLDGTAPIAIELAGVRWVSGRRCGLEFIRIVPEMTARLRAFVSLLENTP
ncbi:MAG: PilZ domain-containing protein [Nitrospiraceae bacterium]